MKLSGIFEPAKDLVYFLAETAVCCSPFKFFLSTSGTYSNMAKHERELATIFSSKSVSLKTYSIMFRPYNGSVVRLVID